MGRAFEYRKATKFKRWGNMARVFTKLGKQITIAVREGGPDPDMNPRLRVLMQQAKKENMPKENIERAIKKAISKDEVDSYKEVLYEGYAPHGIAMIIETATDNPTRTVANIRSCFNRYGGSLSTSGSVQFMFDHKCVFRIAPQISTSLDDLELELIDYGVDEVDQDDDSIVLYGDFSSYFSIQKYLEDHNFEIYSAQFEWIPKDMKELNDDQKAQVIKLIEKIEEDEDVQNIFHNMIE
ncbi:MAG TPA: YebC/PmpR family DNA-binding transcriptional regulator [Paludibacteraceae bacterium]|nr:YebC/PmpR family DNA-binding transcriptional regulator [Paludibacteraceae bacterium]